MYFKICAVLVRKLNPKTSHPEKESALSSRTYIDHDDDDLEICSIIIKLIVFT